MPLNRSSGTSRKKWRHIMSFVLVHGAGMGASCWDRLVPRLTGRVVAVDLPGRGERADIDLRTVTLEDCADAIVADVERMSPTSCWWPTRSPECRSRAFSTGCRTVSGTWSSWPRWSRRTERR
ncbi:alpha/beta hydrolase [Rhodococcus sp. BP-241]|uniref:alpha/beta fold hydrolase n=1 Tax=Rhodococcus sp. BP-241 TaxID=2739441 RepID=UPI0027E1B1A4|nr:alpha/beta hydrolase [Rhodococcus sp. BP-241]